MNTPRDQQLLDLRASGMTYIAIGIQVGLSESYVHERIQRATGKLPKTGRKAVNMDEVRRLHALGWACSHIGPAVGVSGSTVEKRLRAIGIEPHSHSKLMKDRYKTIPAADRKAITKPANKARKATNSKRYVNKITLRLTEEQFEEIATAKHQLESTHDWILEAVLRRLRSWRQSQ